MIMDTVIIKYGERRRQQQYTGNHRAEYRLNRNAEELADICMEILARAADDEINHRKHNLAGEEIIVNQAEQRNGQAKDTAPVLIDTLLHCQQQQREECGHILEMVEEYIIHLEAGECIEQSSDHRCRAIPDEPPDIGIGRHCRNRVLQRQQIRDQIEHPFLRERNRQPEKGAAEQIKRIGADEIRAEIGLPVPAEISVHDSIVCKIVKRKLLRIKVAVIDEESPGIDHNRDQQKHHHQIAQQEYAQIRFPALIDRAADPCPRLSAHFYLHLFLFKNICFYYSTFLRKVQWISKRNSFLF